MTILIYSQMKPNEQKISFQKKMLNFLRSYGIDSVTKNSISFEENIRRTYLVLWVDS